MFRRLECFFSPFHLLHPTPPSETQTCAEGSFLRRFNCSRRRAKGKFRQQSSGSLLQGEEHAAFQWGKLLDWAGSAGTGEKALPSLQRPGSGCPPWETPALFLAGAGRYQHPLALRCLPVKEGVTVLASPCPVPARLGVGRGGAAHPATHPGGFAREKWLFRRRCYQLRWVSSSKNWMQNSPSQAEGGGTRRKSPVLTGTGKPGLCTPFLRAAGTWTSPQKGDFIFIFPIPFNLGSGLSSSDFTASMV